MKKTAFKVVLDTNVFIAAEKSRHAASPNKEVVSRWKNDEFEVLYSEDTMMEYICKLREKGILETTIIKLIQALFELARRLNFIIFLIIQ